MPTFRAHLSGYCSVIQFLCRCFDHVQCVSTFQPTGTRVLELTGFPHPLFDLVDLFLVNKKAARRLAEACNLSGERDIVDVFQHIVEVFPLVSTMFEVPEVVLSILQAFSLIVIGDCVLMIQGT